MVVRSSSTTVSKKMDNRSLINRQAIIKGQPKAVWAKQQTKICCRRLHENRLLEVHKEPLLVVVDENWWRRLLKVGC